jgi:hypothetical protein
VLNAKDNTYLTLKEFIPEILSALKGNLKAGTYIISKA